MHAGITALPPASLAPAHAGHPVAVEGRAPGLLAVAARGRRRRA